MARHVKFGDVPGLADYLAAHARQDDVLRRVEAEAQATPHAAIQVSPDEGALLHVLTLLVAPQRALEIGTFTGYSAICIARALPPGGTLTCLELDPERARAAQANFEAAGVADRITIEVGPAIEALARLPADPPLDLVFVDADKGGYPDYYEAAVARLRAGGLMLLDNTLLRGRVMDPAAAEDERAPVIAALNDRIAADERVDTALALVSDGLTFVRKR